MRAAPCVNSVTAEKTAQRMARKTCLILAEDTGTGNQIASLLAETGWRMHIVCSDRDAYDHMLRENVDVVIADIDATRLGGLAVLVYCYHHDPSVTTYAIAPTDDGYRKLLARDMAGCRGFFYLVKGGREIDSSRGMPVNLVSELANQPASRVVYPG